MNKDEILVEREKIESLLAKYPDKKAEQELLKKYTKLSEVVDKTQRKIYILGNRVDEINNTINNFSDKDTNKEEIKIEDLKEIEWIEGSKLFAYQQEFDRARWFKEIIFTGMENKKEEIRKQSEADKEDLLF